MLAGLDELKFAKHVLDTNDDDDNDDDHHHHHRDGERRTLRFVDDDVMHAET